MERWTQILIVALPLLIGLLDILLIYMGGNKATISRVTLLLSLKQPLIPLSIAYSFAVLMGHLFFPVVAKESPPGYETIARMFVVLSPTIYAMIVIGAGEPSPFNIDDFSTKKQWLLAFGMITVAIIGGLAGRYGLPQHISPNELPGLPRVPNV